MRHNLSMHLCSLASERENAAPQFCLAAGYLGKQAALLTAHGPVALHMPEHIFVAFIGAW